MIRQRLQIEEGALVGMGAVVLRDVAPGTTVVGDPARPLVRAGAA
jgi:acetyltransferase-like isoleucine patch superfamily enzyme